MVRTVGSLMCHRPISSETAVQRLKGSESRAEREADKNWCPQYCREVFACLQIVFVQMRLVELRLRSFKDIFSINCLFYKMFELPR